eukprot:CAMPEP_0201568342 /NCGR_PEP_ID=MMETSP0190_2-20130828/9373_1 /ASSEMBLY_ACC=CAM_ASM_000263 /TAXON_ID=37353 /ORGANISM="Rosalina sp." /LENGTH=66 /DNA_ID=CAMNT_0047989351 /DNA_START=901 /DNA_END=1101 /DNA_ORIENTATION=-
MSFGNDKKSPIDTSTNGDAENTREIPVDSSMKDTQQSTTGTDNIVTITSAPEQDATYDDSSAAQIR